MKDLSQEIVQTWNFDSPIDVQQYRYNGDHAAKVWHVKTGSGNKFYLKEFPDLDKLRLQHTLVTRLHSINVPVAVPVPNKHGDLVTIRDSRMFSLYPALEGSVVELDFASGSTAKKAELYGKAIGILHNGLGKCRDIQGLRQSSLTDSVLNWAYPQIEANMNHKGLLHLAEIIEEYKKEFVPLYQTLPRQIIHRDPHPNNFLFDGDQLTGFIDFDLTEINVRLVDPCYLATSFLLGALGNKDYETKWISIFSAIVRGYSGQNPLSDQEKRALWYILVSIQLIFMGYWCRSKDHSRFTDNYKGLLFLMDYRESLTLAYA